MQSSPGLRCVACLEALASVFASAGASLEKLITSQLANAPSQLLKKVAQGKPNGLLRLFVLSQPNFPTCFFI